MKQQSPNQDSINTYRSLIEGKSKNIDSKLPEDNIEAILRSRTKINDSIVIEIATIGERAEDVFYLKDKEHGIISEEMYPYLEESIIKSIAQS